MQACLVNSSDPEALKLALERLMAGELVAFPTDTVYGLGGLVNHRKAIEELYRVKGREAAKAIPVLLGEADQLGLVALQPNEYAMRLAARFWPGPLTIVLPRNPDLPDELSPYPTIGVRMPDNRFALALLRAAGPLAVSSANLSGGDNSLTAQQVLQQLGDRISLIIDGGRTPGGTPSTVVDCSGAEPTILREGPITLRQILAAIGLLEE